MCTQKKISATVKRFLMLLYLFVHYMLPNLVLLTPLVKESVGLVICYKSYL